MCEKGRRAKPHGGVRKKTPRVNGSVKSLREIRARHAGNGQRHAGTIAQLRAEIAERQDLVTRLEALG